VSTDPGDEQKPLRRSRRRPKRPNGWRERHGGSHLPAMQSQFRWARRSCPRMCGRSMHARAHANRGGSPLAKLAGAERPRASARGPLEGGHHTPFSLRSVEDVHPSEVFGYIVRYREGRPYPSKGPPQKVATPYVPQHHRDTFREEPFEQAPKSCNETDEYAKRLPQIVFNMQSHAPHDVHDATWGGGFRAGLVRAPNMWSTSWWRL
jgi:hypothetical protein